MTKLSVDHQVAWPSHIIFHLKFSCIDSKYLLSNLFNKETFLYESKEGPIERSTTYCHDVESLIVRVTEMRGEGFQIIKHTYSKLEHSRTMCGLYDSCQDYMSQTKMKLWTKVLKKLMNIFLQKFLKTFYIMSTKCLLY